MPWVGSLQRILSVSCVILQLASTLDVLPTILKIVGIQPKENVVLDGFDMSPLLFEDKAVSCQMVTLPSFVVQIIIFNIII